MRRVFLVLFWPLLATWAAWVLYATGVFAYVNQTL